LPLARFAAESRKIAELLQFGLAVCQSAKRRSKQCSSFKSVSFHGRIAAYPLEGFHPRNAMISLPLFLFDFAAVFFSVPTGRRDTPSSAAGKFRGPCNR
jgi:hypothetical protein